MLLLALALLLLPGVAAALLTRPFEPDPSLAPVRGLVTGLAVAAGGMLLVSLGHEWWVVEDWERETTITTRAVSFFVGAIVAAGLGCDVVTVTAVWGRRNWTPLVLTIAWLLVGIGWFASTGEPVDSDASGEARFGLELATWSLLLTTFAAVLGSFSRLAEHRARTARAASGQAIAPDVTDTLLSSATPRPTPRASGWDVAAATAMAAIVVLGFTGTLPSGVWWLLAVASLVAAGVRAHSLVRAKRSVPASIDHQP